MISKASPPTAVLGSHASPKNISPYMWIALYFVTASWLFIPEVRRLMDYFQGGYSSITVIALVPLIASAGFAIPLFLGGDWRRIELRLKIVFIVWVGIYLYGFLVSIADLNLTAGLYDFLSAVVPFLPGLWLASRDENRGKTMERLGTMLLVLCIPVAIYGIYQYTQLPTWDSNWIIASNQISIGPPIPYKFRIFSTLNSNGPCAVIMQLALLMNLWRFRLKHILWFPAFAAIITVLTLTLVRVCWIGLVVGIVLYVIVGAARVKFFTGFAALILFCAASYSVIPFILGDNFEPSVVLDRINTFGDLGNDTSLIDRVDTLSLIASGLGNPVGYGLGVVGVAAKLASPDQSAAVVDNGYIARLLELGVLGFIGFVAVLGSTFWFATANAWRGSKQSATASAVLGSMIWLEFASDHHIGITGFFFALAVFVGCKGKRKHFPSPFGETYAGSRPSSDGTPRSLRAFGP